MEHQDVACSWSGVGVFSPLWKLLLEGMTMAPIGPWHFPWTSCKSKSIPEMHLASRLVTWSLHPIFFLRGKIYSLLLLLFLLYFVIIFFYRDKSVADPYGSLIRMESDGVGNVVWRKSLRPFPPVTAVVGKMWPCSLLPDQSVPGTKDRPQRHQCGEGCPELSLAWSQGLSNVCLSQYVPWNMLDNLACGIVTFASFCSFGRDIASLLLN